MIQDLQNCLEYCKQANGMSRCKNCGLSQEMIDDIAPEYNQAQLYILINALENLMIPTYETEYEFIRNNLLERFRKPEIYYNQKD